MRNGSPIERVADTLTLLRRRPHTAAEMAAVLNCKDAAVRSLVSVLVDKGHARQAAPILVGRNWVSRWEWV